MEDICSLGDAMENALGFAIRPCDKRALNNILISCVKGKKTSDLNIYHCAIPIFALKQLRRRSKKKNSYTCNEE